MPRHTLQVRSFWWWLLACLCCCVGCSDHETESDMAQPPWHLWGNSLAVEVPFSVAILSTITSQVIKVSYARPESFNFLLSAQLVKIPEPANPGQIRVRWDLTIGLGRSRVTLETFEQYLFTWTGPTNPTGEAKWTTQVAAPLREDGVSTTASVIDHIVAEDIQLNARVDWGGAGPFSETAIVQLNAYFAPISHIRPEWYEGKFRGGEDEGK
jgi:hypothetical protein